MTAAAEPDLPFRHDRVHGSVPGLPGQALNDLKLEREADRHRRRPGQEPVVVAAAESEAVAGRREPDPRHEHEIGIGGVHPGRGIVRRFRDPEGASLQPRPRVNAVEREAGAAPVRRTDDARQGHDAPLGQRPADERTRVHLASHRGIGQDQAGPPPGREPAHPACHRAAVPCGAPSRAGRAPGEDRRTQGGLRGYGFRSHSRGHSTSVVLLALPLVLTGCLPLLLGTARVLHPGELSVSVGGMARTTSLPPGIAQPGPTAAVFEMRGGLPGEILDTGITVQAPWSAAWDLKCQVLHQERWYPDIAVRADLGVLQPSFGAALLVSRSAGPVTVTLMAGRDRRSERLWQVRSGPNSITFPNYVKDVQAWGVGAEYELDPDQDVFAGVVCWNPTTRTLNPNPRAPSGVNEEPTYAIMAGLRIRWRLARPPAPTAVLTALRGYVLSEPTPEQFEIGQPGIYRAVVLLDGETRITADGKPATYEDLKQGRAILVQGYALPRASTFLARTIELQ